jgi:hypothetical protein
MVYPLVPNDVYNQAVKGRRSVGLLLQLQYCSREASASCTRLDRSSAQSGLHVGRASHHMLLLACMAGRISSDGLCEVEIAKGVPVRAKQLC